MNSPELRRLFFGKLDGLNQSAFGDWFPKRYLATGSGKIHRAQRERASLKAATMPRESDRRGDMLPRLRCRATLSPQYENIVDTASRDSSDHRERFDSHPQRQSNVAPLVAGICTDLAGLSSDLRLVRAIRDANRNPPSREPRQVHFLWPERNTLHRGRERLATDNEVVVDQLVSGRMPSLSGPRVA